MVLFFLALTNFIWGTEQKIDNKELHALTGLQKFEVITLNLTNDKMDQNVFYDSVTESFKKIGQVGISENESMFSSLLQNGIAFPVCFFSIAKDQDRIEVSLEVLAEVEVLANRYKTTCPIWKKTLFSSTSEDLNQTDLAVAGLAKEMIKNLAEDYMKANTPDSKQLFFQIRKFKGM